MAELAILADIQWMVYPEEISAHVCMCVCICDFRAICRQFGVNTGRLTLAALVLAAGMFTSSTAFLPSSFAMKTTMMAVGCWYTGSIPGAVFFTALGALVGWPFTAALG